MNQVKTYKNLITLCMGFFFLFFSFQALSNLQSTMNDQGHIGVTSQTIIYVTFCISALLTPKLCIKQFGCKWTLVMSIAGYVPYIAANFYPNKATFFISAFLVGLCAAPLWSTHSTYINHIASRHALITKEQTIVVTSRFFGIFYFFFQNTQIWGNLISYVILKQKEEDSVEPIDLTKCGAYFCDKNFNRTNSNLTPPSYEQRFMLIGIYTACSIIAVMIIAIFLDPLRKQDTELDDILIRDKLLASIKQMKNIDQLLLIPLTIFLGLAHAFVLSDFSKAYIACSWGIFHVGYVFICYGVANCIMSLMVSRLLKYISRTMIFILSGILNFIAFLLIYFWIPNPEQPHVFFIFISIWGICDATWRTQISALYGALFVTEIEAGYANLNLWESAGYIIAFSTSTSICMAPKFYMAIFFLISGLIGYLISEMRSHNINKISKPV